MSAIFIEGKIFYEALQRYENYAILFNSKTFFFLDAADDVLSYMSRIYGS